MSEFAHLNLCSEYSVPHGSIRIEALVKQTNASGMNAVALTDNNLHGVPKFYYSCKEHNIKSIIGCQIAVKMSGDTPSHLTLLAKDNAGFQNLINLVTLCAAIGNANLQQLERYAKGLIAFSGGFSSGIYDAFSNNSPELATEYALEFANIYQECFYLEISRIGLTGEDKINGELLELAYGLGIPLVATNNCVFLKKEDFVTYRLLQAMRRGEKFDPQNIELISREQYLKTPQAMNELFADIPEAYHNACEIAHVCNVEFDKKRRCLPVSPMSKKNDENVELRRLAEKGLEQKLVKLVVKDIDAYKARLEYELDIIYQAGFSRYFLIVLELVTWAKSNAILIGPGRGSAVASLVVWALGITEIDPIKYGLSFERFINPGRSSLPDIDIDICSRHREEAITHLKEIYGDDYVAQVVAYDTMGARKALREAGKVLGISEEKVKSVLCYFPKNLKNTLDKSLKENLRLRSLVEKNDDIRNLFDFALKIEGYFCHVSTHASALILSDIPLQEIFPFCFNKDGNRLTQFDGAVIEKLGFSKLDILSSLTLTIINDTLKNIKNDGQKVPDLSSLPMDDAETFALYAAGNTIGVFQMESPGMRRYIMNLKPKNFQDIIAMLALYRPGPIANGLIDEFIKRKNGEKSITYPHESLKICLAETYGIILYQEQVMEIARIIAGFTLAEADILRNAMSKKSMESMMSEKHKFVEGAIKNGINNEIANEIFTQMEKFAGYGFNKAHATAYALLSYRTAWLKVHYPREFMTALISSSHNKNDKEKKFYICECKRMGIPI